ncbi:MAG: hypothetical protein ABJD02_11135 [Paraglaciecola sp.]|uniref:hypothetical protein n=1 Tax=Paraglaciecola sp. TaxID=1920173 RepID=UPI00326741B8
MDYEELEYKFIELHGAEKSTMMGTPCLRYNGQFFSMMFTKESSLILKLPEKRVNELIDIGKGHEFNFTKKRFKEWVLIPESLEDEYEALMLEALNHTKNA